MERNIEVLNVPVTDLVPKREDWEPVFVRQREIEKASFITRYERMVVDHKIRCEEVIDLIYAYQDDADGFEAKFEKENGRGFAIGETRFTAY